MTKPASGIYWAVVVRGPHSSWCVPMVLGITERQAKAAYLNSLAEWGPDTVGAVRRQLRTGEVQIVKVRVEEVE